MSSCCVLGAIIGPEYVFPMWVVGLTTIERSQIGH
jgi:hypothetical protein